MDKIHLLGHNFETSVFLGEVVHTETYYPASDQGDPKSGVLERTKTTTVVQAPHYHGVGPVNDSGVPYALRTVSVVVELYECLRNT